jgi:hypothetical protein
MGYGGNPENDPFGVDIFILHVVEHTITLNTFATNTNQHVGIANGSFLVTTPPLSGSAVLTSINAINLYYQWFSTTIWVLMTMHRYPALNSLLFKLSTTDFFHTERMWLCGHGYILDALMKVGTR